MTKQEALNFMGMIGDKFVGTKQDHLNIQIAMSILNQVVNPPAPPEEVKPAVAAVPDAPKV